MRAAQPLRRFRSLWSSARPCVRSVRTSRSTARTPCGKARLDIFAAELQNDPRSAGYIIATGGKPGEAQRRVSDAKGYLVNTRGMDASRIVTLTGRTGGDIRIEFWLVPPGAEAPTPQ